MFFNIFDTLEEANLVQAYDFEKHLAYHRSIGASEEWLNGTTSWAIPMQRLDGKYIYITCPNSDSEYYSVADGIVLSQDQYDSLDLEYKTFFTKITRDEYSSDWFSEYNFNS